MTELSLCSLQAPTAPDAIAAWPTASPARADAVTAPLAKSRVGQVLVRAPPATLPRKLGWRGPGTGRAGGGPPVGASRARSALRAGGTVVALRALRAGGTVVTLRALRAGSAVVALRALRAGSAVVALRALRAGSAVVALRAL